MLQTIDFAGGRQINAAATFFRYESARVAGADDQIRVRADGADLGLFKPGDAVELPMQAQTWEVTAVNSATVGTVRLGLGRVQSARLVGVVSVIDQSSALTMQDGQFSGSFTCAASASLGSLVLLGSNGPGGKRLAIRSLIASSSTAGRVLVYTGTMGGVLVPAVTLRSKYLTASGAVASGTARCSPFNTAAAVPNATEVNGVTTWYGPYVPASTPVQLISGAPIVMEPGRLIAFSAEVLNRDISLWVEAEEF